MMFHKIMTSRIAASVIVIASTMVAAPVASQAQQAAGAQPPVGEWYKACTKQEDNDVCVVQNIVTAQNGQLLTAVGLILVEGKVNRKIMQVSVPSARLVQPGVSMQIDGGNPQRLEYAVCMPDKCVAEVPLSDAMIASMKRGGEMVLTSVNFQRAPNPIGVSLSGFTAAFDGPPLKQSDIEERQRVLQEEMQKKAEEARKKLEAAQDAAKAAQ